jgi:hypothetical protein
VKHTSLVFTCWERLYQAVSSAVFPPHPVTAQSPVVAFGGVRDVNSEMVVLPGRSQDDRARQTWITQGRPSKQEDFTLDVEVWTTVPGMTAMEAKNRVAELVAVIEACLRDQTTGLPIDIGLDATDGLKQWSVSEIVPTVGPLDTEGFGASCRIGVEFITRL